MNWSKIKKFLFKSWPLLIIFLVAALFFWKFIFKGLLPIPADTIVGMYHPWRDVVWNGFTAGVPFKNFLITDPIRQQIPWRLQVVDALKQKRLPGWNPYILAGTPLLANFQSAPFYIFNLFFFIFDFSIAWGILIFLQPLLAGTFLYLYLRHLKLQKLACLLGSLSFAFSGFFVAWLEWGTILHSALWLPLILLAIDKIFFLFVSKNSGIRRDKQKLTIWSVIFVFSLMESFFAGHLQVFFYVFLATLAYFFWRLFQLKKNHLKAFLLFLILYSLFFILAFIQWQPTWEFIRLSARGLDQTDWQSPGWFIPWQHVVQFLAPDFFGNPSTLNYWGVWNYAELVGFLGVIPLLFAFWAIFEYRHRKLFFFLILAVVILSFALPTPWAKVPYQLRLPLLSTSQPTRLLLLVDFCLAILAAFGFDGFLKKKKMSVFFLIAIFVYGCLWLFVLTGAKFWPEALWVGNLAVSRRNLILPTAILLAGIFFIWIISLAPKKFFAKISLFFLLFLTCFDLVRFGWKFTPFVKKDWLFPSTKIIEFLQKDNEIFRLMSTDRRIMPPNFAAVYRLQSIDGYDPLFLRRYAELISASERGEPNISPPFGFNRIITPQNYQSRLIDLLNVKYVLSLEGLESEKLELVFQEGATRVYENKNAFPRVFMVYNYQVARNKQEAIKLLMNKKNNLRQLVILEENLATQLAESKKEKIFHQAKIKEYQENRVIIEAESNQEGILVLTDAYYPGWRATVDPSTSSGQVETEIYRADYHFRAIIVPKGKHEVVFEYGY